MSCGELMDSLPVELRLKIFCFLDHQNLAAAIQGWVFRHPPGLSCQFSFTPQRCQLSLSGFDFYLGYRKWVVLINNESASDLMNSFNTMDGCLNFAAWWCFDVSAGHCVGRGLIGIGMGMEFSGVNLPAFIIGKWKDIASDNALWSNLFRERWGEDKATSHAPTSSESWKDAYEVQDRCDRVGSGVKIIREGGNYYVVHKGKIQRHLGSRTQKRRVMNWPSRVENGEGPTPEEISSRGILDKILFFLGDLEVASMEAKAAKRSRVL